MIPQTSNTICPRRHKWTRSDGTSTTTPTNGGPNQGMSPHLAPRHVDKLAQFKWFSQVRSVGTSVPTKTTFSAPPSSHTRTRPADARQNTDARNGLQPRTKVLFVGTAVPSPTERARQDRARPNCGGSRWILHFGHRIGRSHGASRCRQAVGRPPCQLPFPQAVNPSPQQPRYNRQIDRRSAIGSCPRLGSHPMSGLVV